MRLKRKHDAASRKAFAHRGERRRHFGGMMTVVIDQREDSTAFDRHVAVSLKAPIDAFEFGERPGDCILGHAHFAADRDRGQRVLHVVGAGRRQIDRQIRRARGPGGEAHSSGCIDDIDGAKLRVLGKTVGYDRLRDLRQNGADIRIVDAQHRQAAGRSR